MRPALKLAAAQWEQPSCAAELRDSRQLVLATVSQQSQSGFWTLQKLLPLFPPSHWKLPSSLGWWNRDGNMYLSRRQPGNAQVQQVAQGRWAGAGVRVYFISVPNCCVKPLEGFEWDTSCPDLCGDRRGLPQCPARLPGRASSAPRHGHPGESAVPCPSARQVPGCLRQPLSPGSPAGALLRRMCSSRDVAAWGRTCSSLSCSPVLNGART